MSQQMQMDFFSMGMFCVDEVHTENASFTNIIGGAGTYAALGAAIVLPVQSRQKVGFICDEGYDFNPKMKNEMLKWSMGIIFRFDKKRETTKAWNKFVNNEERLFKYLSPKLQIVAEDMKPPARNAKVVHLICSPPRAEDFLKKLRIENPDQLYVWEPVPTACNPENFAGLRSVVESSDRIVLSPNLLEAAAFVGLAEPQSEVAIEELISKHYGFAPNMVVRCGARGCYLRTPDMSKWYPAYFTTNQKDAVVDPSGAGNAFTGGMGQALANNLSWDEAVAYGSVSSSFMIQQLGTPTYDENLDTWNGESARNRLDTYMRRINCHISI